MQIVALDGQRVGYRIPPPAPSAAYVGGTYSFEPPHAIGLTLARNSSGVLVVVGVGSGSLAADGGVRAGMSLLYINGESTAQCSETEALDKIAASP